MSGPDASSAEMPGFPSPRWPGGELTEPLLDALLSGQPLPPAAPEQARAVAIMLISLAGQAGPGELAGEMAARFAFTSGTSPAGISPAARRPARRKPFWLPARVSVRMAATMIAAAVGLGGTAAAYAGVLPGPIQGLAHRMIHAPAPQPASRIRPRPQPAESRPHASSQPALPGEANSHARPHPRASASGQARAHRHPSPQGHARAHRHPRPHRHPNPNSSAASRPASPGSSPNAASRSGLSPGAASQGGGEDPRAR